MFSATCDWFCTDGSHISIYSVFYFVCIFVVLYSTLICIARVCATYKSMLLCYQGGEVKGFNDEALQQIIKFFVLKPADRGIDLRPYLTDEEAPVNRGRLINHKGDNIIEQPPIGRWQYPRNPVYF